LQILTIFEPGIAHLHSYSYLFEISISTFRAGREKL
jgi:hypothetical protein